MKPELARIGRGTWFEAPLDFVKFTIPEHAKRSGCEPFEIETRISSKGLTQEINRFDIAQCIKPVILNLWMGVEANQVAAGA